MTADTTLHHLETMATWLRAHPDATVISATVQGREHPVLHLSEAYFRGHFAGEVVRTSRHTQSIRFELTRDGICFCAYAPQEETLQAVRL